MRLTIEGPPEPVAPKRPVWERLAWFAALWLGGLSAVAAAAYALRALLA